MNPVQVLRDGAAELAAILEPHGFRFVQTRSGRSCGRHDATGEYRRGDRRLELHVRWSLGLVAYQVGADSLSHEDFTRAVKAAQVLDESASYPGFSNDPLDGFRHLGSDLVRFGRVFTDGTAEEFAALAAWVRQYPNRKGLPR